MRKQLKLFQAETYCIDASALINLKGYPEDLFPTIRKKIETMTKDSRLISHLEVLKEIMVGKDEMSKWCKKNGAMFKDVDGEQIQKFQEVKAKYDKDYWQKEINRTGPWADPWVIALSACEGTTIVTDENPGRPNRIPAIANQLGIKCISLLDFFRQIGVKY